jgi:arginyl-tRNA synthetase
MQDLIQAITVTVKSVYNIELDEVSLTRPDPRFGDFATNVAMRLAGRVGKAPNDVAKELVQALESVDFISKVDIAGPGFINMWVNDSNLWQLANSREVQTYKGQTFVVEYSCPNYFKELHAGHLYQTVYGNAIARMIERTGATVHRTNFGADVGLSAARAMWGILHTLGGENPSKLDDIAATERTTFIASSYVAGATADVSDDEAVKEQIKVVNKRIYAMHAEGDTSSDFAKIYYTTRDWSREYFIQLYNELMVDAFEKYYPESTTEQRGVAEVKARIGSVFKESNGAIVFDGEAEGLHTRVFITKEQLPTYETKDLGLILIEMDDFHFDKRVLLTGSEQREYMKVVWRATDKVLPGVEAKMTHLTNGLIRFGDGQKMSSRLGNVTTAMDVIAAVKNAVSDTGNETINKQIYLGALKYELLKYVLGGDIAFDPQNSVSTQGNSGPYIQYAHARACSILAKVTKEHHGELQFDEAERVLVQKLSEYVGVVEQATQKLETHTICNYLYELSGVFNAFYEKSRVVGDEREETRAAIVRVYKDTLADGLFLLGIDAPDHM